MANDFENQLDKIRVELYEQTKDMTNADAAKAANDHGQKLAAKYGIKIMKGAQGPLTESARAL